MKYSNTSERTASVDVADRYFE